MKTQRSLGFSCDLNVSILTIESSLPLCIWMSWDRPSAAVKWCQLKLVAFYSFNWVTCKPGLTPSPPKPFRKSLNSSSAELFSFCLSYSFRCCARKQEGSSGTDPGLWKTLCCDYLSRFVLLDKLHPFNWRNISDFYLKCNLQIKYFFSKYSPVQQW